MANYSKGEALEWASECLRGEWSTLMTPFTLDDRVDEQALRHNVRHVRSLGTRGAGCTWGMGEFWSLTREERLLVYDTVSDEAAGEWLIGAHVSHTSIKETLMLADHAEAAGFDLLIAGAPYFVTKTEGQVVEFIRLLAEATNLAVMFYNSPQFGIVMSADGLRRICDIPNVVGVKEASFNRDLTIEAHRLLGDAAIISAPDEWVLFKGREMGFQQQVMFANTSDWRFDRPGANYYVQFIDRATTGDIDDALYEERLKPIKSLSDKWWQYTTAKFGGALPASMCKYWGELMGLRHGSVRPPLSDLDEEEKARLKSELESVQNAVSTAAGG